MMNIQYLLSASNSINHDGVNSPNVIYFVNGNNVDYFRPIIATSRTTVAVEAPYHTGFISRAYELGGVFQKKKWVFSYREELDVRKACEEYFGYDGITDPIKADVKIVFNDEVESKPNQSINILSRPIARVSPRQNKDPLIAPGTLIKKGSITVKGDRVVIEKDTEIVLRSVPISLVKNTQETSAYSIEVTDVDQQALELLFYEYDQLVTRFAEVRYLLDTADVDLDMFLQQVKERHEPHAVNFLDYGDS